MYSKQSHPISPLPKE
ncbi:hypothetical protein D047_2666, partial [Vibrio parahaemolyticus VPTS-2010_2]